MNWVALFVTANLLAFTLPIAFRLAILFGDVIDAVIENWQRRNPK